MRMRLSSQLVGLPLVTSLRQHPLIPLLPKQQHQELVILQGLFKERQKIRLRPSLHRLLREMILPEM